MFCSLMSLTLGSRKLHMIREKVMGTFKYIYIYTYKHYNIQGECLSSFHW